MTQPFNFSKFMDSMANPDLDTMAALQSEAVRDEIEAAMAAVAPRIWSIMLTQMAADPHNTARSNAIINSALFAVLAWTAACLPKDDPDGQDLEALLKQNVLSNLDSALLNRGPEHAVDITQIAMGQGKIQLLEDALRGTGEQVQGSAEIINNLHKYIISLTK